MLKSLDMSLAVLRANLSSSSIHLPESLRIHYSVSTSRQFRGACLSVRHRDLLLRKVILVIRESNSQADVEETQSAVPEPPTPNDLWPRVWHSVELNSLGELFDLKGLNKH